MNAERVIWKITDTVMDVNATLSEMRRQSDTIHDLLRFDSILPVEEEDKLTMSRLYSDMSSLSADWGILSIDGMSTIRRLANGHPNDRSDEFFQKAAEFIAAGTVLAKQAAILGDKYVEKCRKITAEREAAAV